MATIKVDNVSKKRNSFVSNEKWFNFPKDSPETFPESVKRGTTLEVEADNGIISEYKIISNEAPKKPFVPRQGPAQDPTRDAKIALGNALNAVFAPVYTFLTTKEGQSHPQAFQETMDVVRIAAKELREAK